MLLFSLWSQRESLAKRNFSKNLLDFSYLIYYDKGQQVVEKALLQSFGIIGYPVDFKDNVKADNYRLFQLTDFICSISLIETKMSNHELSKSESRFFNDPQSFKKYYLKALAKKTLK